MTRQKMIWLEKDASHSFLRRTEKDNCDIQVFKSPTSGELSFFGLVGTRKIFLSLWVGLGLLSVLNATDDLDAGCKLQRIPVRFIHPQTSLSFKGTKPNCVILRQNFVQSPKLVRNKLWGLRNCYA